MQVLCGLQVVFFLFNCQTPELLVICVQEIYREVYILPYLYENRVDCELEA